MAKPVKSEIKIEKAIPVPRPKNGGWLGHAAILRQMNIGDSVLLQTSLGSANSSARGVFGAGKFACRTVEGGIRVWRTA